MKTLSFALLAATVLVAGCVTTPVKQLETASRNGDLPLVKKLLDAGVVPGEGRTQYGLTDGIGWADYFKHEDILKLLMKRCREVYVHDQNCADAPCVAAYKGDTESISAFMARGLDVNTKGGYGITMLGCAAERGNVASAKFLIEHGADIDLTISTLADKKKASTMIPFLERLRPGGTATTAPTAASGGISKLEMEQIVKSAVAATKAPAEPSSPAEIKSDVDQPVYKAPTNPDAFAVVVGVEKYNALPDARFAERDAKAMNAHLLAMGYPQRNIVLLTGHQATKTGLIKNLEAWLPNQVTERSTVLFYFSGHGAPDAKTSAAYLVPTDGDPQYLEETAYPIKRLYEKLGALKAKRVLVALDSCFSGAGGRSVIASGTRPLVSKLKLAPTEAKVVSLSASSAEEITGALEDQGHGLFTYHLLKALSETAGRGSVSELHAALTPRVQDEARRQNRSQTPQMFGASVDSGLR